MLGGLGVGHRVLGSAKGEREGRGRKDQQRKNLKWRSGVRRAAHRPLTQAGRRASGGWAQHMPRGRGPAPVIHARPARPHPTRHTRYQHLVKLNVREENAS